ncbi:MAG TPA: tetratricopeptide repeat protein, partial [Alphaproteobacteria bacterium]|nr:tetratricopeptide repeat protein [Alphaproteobacteria bacterium]
MAVALAHDPANIGLLHRTFVLALSGGDMDLAVTLAERVLQGDPENQLAGLLLVLDDAERGDFAAAFDRLSTLEKDGAGRFIMPMIEGWLRAGLDDRAGAVAALEDLAGTPGFGPLAQLQRGLILDWMGDLEAARTAYEAALGDGISLQLTMALGSLYERVGDDEAARALYARYLTGNPDNLMLEPALQRMAEGDAEAPRPVVSPQQGIAEALLQIASALTQEQASDLSLTYLRLALFLQPDSALAQVLLGDVLAGRGELEKSLAAYQSVPVDSPASWPARLSAARTLDDLGRTDEAVALLTAMVQERPEHGDVYIALGDLHRRHERFEEAIAAYDEALEREPMLAETDWSFFYRRGIALERAREWQRAEADLQHAIELNPEHAHLLNYLGYSWIDRGENLVEAQAMIEKAVALMPEDGFIIDSLGWAYYRTGQTRKAVETLERAASLQPDDPIINDHLGDAYWTAGRREEAKFQWRRALGSAGPDERELILSIESKLAHGLSKPGATGGAVTGGEAAMREDKPE